MEKKCKWHFKPEGGRDVGPNDPINENFKGRPYSSIVRESIQNSLDAVDDADNPVKVKFTFFHLKKADFPHLFDIESHIKQSAEYYSDNDNAKRLFGDMSSYLESASESLSCLKISDYNTVGMDYDASVRNTKSPFYAFLRAGGVSAKSHGSGGSFGFGKGAYYTLSPIKTIIVSTKTNLERFCFEGSTILTTHKSDSGEILTAYGYYDNNNGEPTCDEDSIPEIFKRDEIGTDVNVIGLWDVKNHKDLMIKSVLNNFWLAIYHGKLVVEIDGLVIHKENLENVISRNFSSDGSEGALAEMDAWNPTSYLKAVKYANETDNFLCFKDELETLGSVELYVYLEKGLPNRTAYFRKPKMVVFKKGTRKINGYAAVFICENDKGNEILRLMENPSHSVWEKENYPQDKGNPAKTARDALREIENFINKNLESLAKTNPNKKINIWGLEEYLFIPEDLLENDEKLEGAGNASSNVYGDRSGGISDIETGSTTTDKKCPIRIKPTINPKSPIKEEKKFEMEAEGEKIGTIYVPNPSPNPHPEPSPKPIPLQGKENDEGKSARIPIKIGLRVLAQSEGNQLYHILILISDRQIENAQLELFVGADDGGENGIDINFCDLGSPIGNLINNVSLSRGSNKIKVRFSDNLRHSVKLKAYEIQ